MRRPARQLPAPLSEMLMLKSGIGSARALQGHAAASTDLLAGNVRSCSRTRVGASTCEQRLRALAITSAKPARDARPHCCGNLPRSVRNLVLAGAPAGPRGDRSRLNYAVTRFMQLPDSRSFSAQGAEILSGSPQNRSLLRAELRSLARWQSVALNRRGSGSIARSNATNNPLIPGVPRRLAGPRDDRSASVEGVSVSPADSARSSKYAPRPPSFVFISSRRSARDRQSLASDLISRSLVATPLRARGTRSAASDLFVGPEKVYRHRVARCRRGRDRRHWRARPGPGRNSSETRLPSRERGVVELYGHCRRTADHRCISLLQHLARALVFVMSFEKLSAPPPSVSMPSEAKRSFTRGPG